MGTLQNIINSIYQSTRSPAAAVPIAPTAQGAPPIVPQHMATVDSGFAPPPAPVQAVTPPLSGAPQGSDGAPGIMQTIGGVLAPQAGSFWASALKHGLAGAHEGQITDALAQGNAATEAATKAEALKKLREGDELTPVGTVVHRNEDGTYKEVYRPVPNPTEQERLIAKWQAAPDGPLKTLLERAIKGFQFTPEVIANIGRARSATAVAGAAARAKYRIGPAGAGSKLPPGATLD